MDHKAVHMICAVTVCRSGCLAYETVTRDRPLLFPFLQPTCRILSVKSVSFERGFE